MSTIKTILGDMTKNHVKGNVIITDLPYGTTANKKDVVIPWKQLWSFIEDSGAHTFITTAQTTFMVELINSIPKGWKWYDMVWNKEMSSNRLNAKRQPMRTHENIIIIYKKGHYYKPVKWDSGKFYNAKKGKFLYGKENVTNNNYGKSKRVAQINTTYRYPITILKHKKPHPSVARHRTAKPISFYEALIKMYSKEGWTIIDPTFGSGASGKAAMNLNRNYIGIEMDLKYYRNACQWFMEVK